MGLVFDGTPDAQIYTPISNPQHVAIIWSTGLIPTGAFDRTFNAPNPPPYPPDLSKYSWLVIDWDVPPIGPLPGAGPNTEAGVSGNCQVYFNNIPVITLSGGWYIHDTMLGHSHYYHHWRITTGWKFIALAGLLYSIRCVGSWTPAPSSILSSEMQFTAELWRSRP
jgi:hypothetical protein